jgi:hypothetical protein
VAASSVGRARAGLPLVAIALLAVLAALVATLPARVSPVDSGELSAVARHLGIAHPTGYPLWTPIARLVALVPVGPSLPWRLALASALAATAVLALLAPVFARAARGTRGAGAPTPSAARLVAPALILLASSLSAFLAVARTAEVYALSLLALALVARLAHEAAEGRVSPDRAVVLGAYVVGLGSGAHMTLLLALPAFAYLGLRGTHRPAAWALAAAFGALGASVFAFLPIRSACQPALDWGNPETPRALASHILAWQYRVWMFESADLAWKNLAALAGEAWRAFSLLVVLAPLGWMRLSRVAPRALHASVLLVLAQAAYAAGYSIHDIAIYFLPILLAAVFWIGAGAWEAIERLHGAARRAAPLVPALLVVAAAASWRAHAPRERAEADVADGFARALLESLPPRAVVLSRLWDVFVSPAIEMQLVEGVRRDVVVLDQEHLRRSWHVPLLARAAPDVAEAAERESAAFLDLLAPFEAGRPFDRDRLQAAYERMVGALLAADPTRPIFATIDVEPALVAPYGSVPWGSAMRLLRAGELAPPLFAGPMPAWPPLTIARAGRYGAAAAEVAGEMAAANAERALAAGDSTLARRRLADADALGRATTPRAARVRAALNAVP